jgi:hypothetical protein
MNLWVPKFPWRLLPRMLAMAVVGALISGFYGVVHDQITYSISPEYFTRMKFEQFRAADFGFPERMFVAEIGFLATWWVGFFGGWFLGRIAVPVWPARQAWKHVMVGLVVMSGIAVLAGAVGFGLGLVQQEIGPMWIGMTDELGVLDVRAFMRVGYIHNAGYLGGLTGLVAAIVMLLGMKRRKKTVDL